MLTTIEADRSAIPVQEDQPSSIDIVSGYTPRRLPTRSKRRRTGALVVLNTALLALAVALPQRTYAEPQTALMTDASTVKNTLVVHAINGFEGRLSLAQENASGAAEYDKVLQKLAQEGHPEFAAGSHIIGTAVSPDIFYDRLRAQLDLDPLQQQSFGKDLKPEETQWFAISGGRLNNSDLLVDKGLRFRVHNYAHYPDAFGNLYPAATQFYDGTTLRSLYTIAEGFTTPDGIVSYYPGQYPKYFTSQTNPADGGVSTIFTSQDVPGGTVTFAVMDKGVYGPDNTATRDPKAWTPACHNQLTC
ncbi:MAG: hypothetical protein M3Q44_08225 [bacterium]|nr:hypothetical protein [bacterium]